MKKIFKWFIVVLIITVTFIGVTLLVDYLADDIDIVGLVKQSTIDMKNLDSGNSKSFRSKKIEGKLKVEEYLGEYKFIKMTANNKVVNMPIPNSSIRNTYKDTIFDVNGSFYVAIFESEIEHEEEEVTYKEHYIGKKSPVVIEVKLPNDNTTIYIQCYDNESLGFYSNYDWSKLEHYEAQYDLNLSDDELSKSVKINESIIPNTKDMFIKDEYINIVNNNRSEYEGYKDFHIDGNNVFYYYRTVGYLDTSMRVEYARLVSLGYEPKEYGYYSGMSYIKFNEITVLGSPITNNSSLIYYITE